MFDVDLMNARKVELEFLKLVLTPWVVHVYIPKKDKQFKDYDMKIEYEDWHTTTFEIKDCPRALEYGSIPFEIECNGKPSWIYASKADYIVYHIWDKRYRQDRGKLLYELVQMKKYETFGWDNDKAKMYVVDLEVAKLFLNEFIPQPR